MMMIQRQTIRKKIRGFFKWYVLKFADILLIFLIPGSRLFSRRQQRSNIASKAAGKEGTTYGGKFAQETLGEARTS
jgi:hypothetical protein